MKDQLIAAIDRLSPDQQAHVLAVVQQLQSVPLPPGTSGDALLKAQERFTFAPGDVDEMMQIIEEGCENIDWDGWR
jgi:hypothetical protein